MRASDTFAAYADLRARVRHTLEITGPYQLSKDYLVIPQHVPEESLVKDGETTLIISEPTIRVREGTVVAVDLNPQLETVGLVTYRPFLTSSISGAQPLIVRVEAETDFNISHFSYLARLYIYR